MSDLFLAIGAFALAAIIISVVAIEADRAWQRWWRRP
jgi:hypothetical protein